MIFLSDYLKRIYGTKVYKLSLSSGCTCPNRDGTLSFGGCTFCSEGGSGDFAAPFLPIQEQIALAKEKVARKLPRGISPEDQKYIAYFQSFTNTYGDTRRLFSLYQEAISLPEIVILSVGTRPDCIDGEKLAMLRELNQIKPVWVELGLQTANDETAARCNRGYPRSVFEKTYEALRAAGIPVIVHLIFGLPGETRQDMLSSVRYLAGLNPPPDGVKLQLLHVLRGTALGDAYQKTPFPTLSLEEYTDLIVESLRILPDSCVIHRITGDGPKRLLLAPLWSADKKRVLNHLHRALLEEGLI
ncbi:MAG: TIGR01212 family radical SAM protein [Lachnospiraceae bacterium]|jgi:radical SAM protein (TIGR01212 family)|nr:TIGR01212 family radical SAM protein [Lachnospiraceae bacterium]MCI1398707.1 TIGR01212 family radical SAM protein [Lachnospiraceae bacterium]MCI1423856.1 TIGR01212 family radical SAM protein [Lachnospiraceae bacterium]MCI1452292.1 TIGR01212 family radical SAM protein [Lachnospiraceae bacterium]